MHKLLHFYRAICYNEKVHCMVRPISGRAAVGTFTPDHKEGFQTARKHDKEGARQRILSTCVRLFLEQGFSKTPPRQIIEEADVSVGTFYHIFESKSAVLTELTVFMFENQFGIAQQFIDPDASPAMLYAVETAIQLALVEQNENLRDIYVEAYTQPALLGMIQQRTAKVISRIFRPYLPDCEACDFYEMEIGTAALMRGYMARPCDMYFTLERKIQRFLTMSLRIYKVPDAEQRAILDGLRGLDFRGIASQVMQRLFAQLSMKYDFTLSAPSEENAEAE